MIKQDLLDYELHLDGKHIADFDDLETAKHFGYALVESESVNECVIINKWTGELVYHAYAQTTRRIIEE